MAIIRGNTDEFSVRDGVIFIPQTLRQKIKQKLHDSHIGSQGCLCRARETVYWPGMKAEIADYIQKCNVCTCMALQSTRNYYSGYFEVDQLRSKTVTVIIKKLKRHFVTHKTPNELLSGNEPSFHSAEFENFL